MADEEGPRNADFIAQVVSDAKSPPETQLLSGWFGEAADEGFRRLYLNADLSSWVDIPADAILHTEAIRDVQPSGGVYAWIRRDADLKHGGSASGRAARFLQGQVQQDFASGALDPVEAGYRCVTQAPCGEVTGITGRCTKQPVVGGAWPCITAIPHCVEPTGFTGQCTHQPWPHPTRYLGCTIFHCPTQDLTHNPHICNIVASGMPGCTIVDPQGGGAVDPGPGAKLAADAGGEGGGGAAERTAPATTIPGCGYTQTWGLCPTIPPKCAVSVQIDCIPRTVKPQQCQTFPNAFAAGARAAVGTEFIQCNPSAVDACPTRLRCDTRPPTAFCTQAGICPPVTQSQDCPTFCGAGCQTQQEGCTQLNCTQIGPQCPPQTIGIACTSVPPCPPPPDAGARAFAAAAPAVAGGSSRFGDCTLIRNCPTQPSGDCTFFGCPPTPATVCTQTGPQCPLHTIGILCHTFPRHCGPSPLPWFCPPSPLPWHCPAPSPLCPPLTQIVVCGGPSAVDACPTRLCGGGA